MQVLNEYSVLSNSSKTIFPIRKDKKIISTILYRNDGKKYFQKIAGGRTQLMRAAKKGDLEDVKYLAGLGAKIA